jgi:hypothetical protein
MITINNRKAKFMELKSYCTFAKDNDYIEVTEWSNGEGYDVTISNTGETKHLSLTIGEFEALTVLINYRGE